MIKSILVIAALVAVSLAYNEAPVYTLSQGPEIVTLEPGVPVTTGFNQYSIGSQFRIFLPNNISTVSITWTRSAAVAGCSSSAWARLYGKWGTWPCSANAYSFNSELCEDRVDFGYSASSPLVVNLNADNSKYLDYWDSTNNNDFLRGDYLYLASWLDTTNQNCTATINVTLDYCPDGTIAAEGPSTSPQCVAVTNITTSTHSETVVANGPFDKFWLVHLPQNASGIRASITQTNITSLYLYGRVSTAAIQSNYYSSYASGSGNFTYWWANPPAGDFIITVHTASGSPNIVFDIAISVQSCPAGFSSDDYGNCTFPLTTLASPYDLTTPISVDIPASPTSSDCNWRVYALPIPAWTYTFFNVSVTETAGTSAYVSLRKNAWPTKNIYDDLSQTNYKWTFTPDDFYINTTTWWYLGFCNPSSSEASSWTLAAAYSALPSPSPVPVSPSPVASRSPSPAAASSSPSASPSTGASHSPVPSASSSPDAGSDSGASSTVASVLVILAALVVLF